VTGKDVNGVVIWLMDASTAKYVAHLDSQEASEEPAKPFEQVIGGAAGGQSGGFEPSRDDLSSLDILMDIPLEISVELGRVRMFVKDVLDLGTGSIVELDKAAGEPVDVLVNGRLVAKGEVVVIEDNFGVRITEILTPQERLTRLAEVA
jgi:flagellar motor switch protein FliN/FliY